MIKNIWIIDDDDIFQFTAQKYMELKNVSEKTTVFSNGAEALNHLQQALTDPDDKPDVILLDINMPVLDGWQFLKEFARYHKLIDKKVLIYLTTSSIDQADLEKARKIEDVTDYIIKPLNDEKINMIIEKYREVREGISD